MNVFPNWYLVAASTIFVIVTVAIVFASRGLRRAEPFMRRKQWRHLGIAVLLLVIAIRPTVGNVLTTTYTAGADVVLMIDRTTSMGALDYDGDNPRMDGVRADVNSLVTSMAGSRFAVVVFDNNARVALPFTTDASAVISLVDAMDWRNPTYGNGTDITIGLDEAQTLLARSQETHPELDRYLFYFGDGEQTISTAPQSFEPLSGYLTESGVFGYGTQTGAQMLVSRASTAVVADDSNIPQISQIDEQNLTTMAQQLGGSYQHRTQPTSLEVQVDNPTLIPVAHRDPRGFEIYWIAGLLAAGLLTWELWETVAYDRRARKEWL